MYKQFGIIDRPTISPSNCDTNRDACPSETTYIRLLGKRSKGLVFAPMGALRLLQYHHVSSVIVQSVSSLFHISGRRLVQSKVWMGSGQKFLAVCWDVMDRIPDFREPFFLFLDHVVIVNARHSSTSRGCWKGLRSAGMCQYRALIPSSHESNT
jgi:hypothetical protein